MIDRLLFHWTIFIERTSKAVRPADRKRYLLSIVSILLVVVVMVVLFLFRRQMAGLGNWGYLGAFLIGLIANATVILPMPGLLLLFPLGITFNPFLIALAGAAGGAIGELAGYMLGYGGHTFVRNYELFLKVEKWMGRRGVLTVFLFALVPFLPIDIVGIVAGAVKFPVWKFLAACFSGKAVLYIVLTLASAWGWNLVQGWIT